MCLKPAIKVGTLNENLAVFHLYCGERVTRQMNPVPKESLGHVCIPLGGFEIHPFRVRVVL